MVLLYWCYSLDQKRVTSQRLLLSFDSQQHKVVMLMLMSWIPFVRIETGRRAHKTLRLQMNAQYLGSG